MSVIFIPIALIQEVGCALKLVNVIVLSLHSAVLVYIVLPYLVDYFVAE